MVAELTAWILLKALFFSVLVFGPIVLVLIAVDNQLKKTPNGVYAAEITRASMMTIITVLCTGYFVWVGLHHIHLVPHDWFQVVVAPVSALSAWQDWQKVRRLAADRRRLKALAETEDALPSEFHYASDSKR